MRRVGGVLLILLGALALAPAVPPLLVGASPGEVRCGVNGFVWSVLVVASAAGVLLGFAGLTVLCPGFMQGRRRLVLLSVLALAGLALAWLWLWAPPCPFPSR